MNDSVSLSPVEENGLSPARWLARLTVYDALYLALLAAAALMRLVDLGRLPLSPAEAGEALAVWRLWQPGTAGAVVAAGGSSPAYFSLTVLLTQLFGFTDGVMRLVPALFSLAAVGLPWFLKKRLGHAGSLTLGILLAVSPLHTAAARTAGGQAIGIFALLLLLVAWVRFQESGSSAWRTAVFAALGLGLSSDPIFYAGLVTLALAWRVQAWTGPRWNDKDKAEDERPSLLGDKRAITAGTAVFLAASTLFLLVPAGLGRAAGLAAEWVLQRGPHANIQHLFSPLLALVRYEPALVLFGLAAVVFAGYQLRPLSSLSLYWLVAGLTMLLLQRGVMANALLVTLPGFLLVSVMARDLLDDLSDWSAWALAGAMLAMSAVALINVARYSRVVLYTPEQRSNLWMAAVALAIAGTAIYFVASWQPKAAYQGTFLGLLAFLLVISWGTAWWLGHFAANDPRERWVSRATDGDIRVLTQLVRDISRQVDGSDDGVDIFSTVDSAALNWYLRSYDQLKTGDVLPPFTINSIVLTADESDPALGSAYAGTDFGLALFGPVPDVVPADPYTAALRWWLFHDSDAAVGEERIVLWWRSDLAQQP